MAATAEHFLKDPTNISSTSNCNKLLSTYLFFAVLFFCHLWLLIHNNKLEHRKANNKIIWATEHVQTGNAEVDACAYVSPRCSIHRFRLLPEVAWKWGLRALEKVPISTHMADQRDRNKICHKCCAAVLCKNRFHNRKDLIFHAVPCHQSQRKIWMVRMKCSNKKFTSNTSLFCCSEHFTSNDYKKSLTDSRHDLVRNTVPSIFPWTAGGSWQREWEIQKSKCSWRWKTWTISCWPIGNEVSSDAVNYTSENTHREKESENKPQERETYLSRFANSLKSYLFQNSP